MKLRLVKGQRFRPYGRAAQRSSKDRNMYRTKQVFKRMGQVLALQTALISAGPALAELEIARDLMEAGNLNKRAMRCGRQPVRAMPRPKN